MPQGVQLALQAEFTRQGGTGAAGSGDVTELQSMGKQFVEQFEAAEVPAPPAPTPEQHMHHDSS